MAIEEPTALEYVTAVGSVATPVLVLALSAIGWRIKAGYERSMELENKLRDDRIEIYNEILEPFVILLMSDSAWARDKKNKNRDKNEVAINTMLSLDYRRLGFKLSLLGSDGVVKSYNELMQYFYNRQPDSSDDQEVFVGELLQLLGTFLLEIRKSMGNEDTKLDSLDMCEWWMSEARKFRADGRTA